jgi:hypothetical protein
MDRTLFVITDAEGNLLNFKWDDNRGRACLVLDEEEQVRRAARFAENAAHRFEARSIVCHALPFATAELAGALNRDKEITQVYYHRKSHPRHYLISGPMVDTYEKNEFVRRLQDGTLFT